MDASSDGWVGAVLKHAIFPTEGPIKRARKVHGFDGFSGVWLLSLRGVYSEKRGGGGLLVFTHTYVIFAHQTFSRGPTNIG